MKKRLELATGDANESISDSLCKVVEAYDKEIHSSFSPHHLWRRHFDNQGMSELKSLIKRQLGGLLEGDWTLLNEIKKIVEARKLRAPTGGDALTKQVFDYLEERIKYIEQRQRRSPDDLTADYKILLIGDGWVRRSHPNNPVLKRIALVESDPKFQDLVKGHKSALRLENRGFLPEQTFTVDHNPAQLPDITSRAENLGNDLPKNCFNCIYLEGMAYDSEEETQQAINVLKPFLQHDGLIIYHTPKPNSVLKISSKSGEAITQEQLDNIPKCVKESVNRTLIHEGYPLLEDVTPNGTNEIILDDPNKPPQLYARS